MKSLKVIVTGLVIAMSISGMSASLSSIFRKKKNKSNNKWQRRRNSSTKL